MPEKVLSGEPSCDETLGRSNREKRTLLRKCCDRDRLRESLAVVAVDRPPYKGPLGFVTAATKLS
jgi:hypothetical protein